VLKLTSDTPNKDFLFNDFWQNINLLVYFLDCATSFVYKYFICIKTSLISRAK
jgi:hypothetical protein